MVFAISGDAPFWRLLRSGVRLLGARYDVEAFEVARPDAMCGQVWAVRPGVGGAARCGWCVFLYFLTRYVTKSYPQPLWVILGHPDFLNPTNRQTKEKET